MGCLNRVVRRSDIRRPVRRCHHELELRAAAGADHRTDIVALDGSDRLQDCMRRARPYARHNHHGSFRREAALGARALLRRVQRLPRRNRRCAV